VLPLAVAARTRLESHAEIVRNWSEAGAGGEPGCPLQPQMVILSGQPAAAIHGVVLVDNQLRLAPAAVADGDERAMR
jgi:hypothetical protein